LAAWAGLDLVDDIAGEVLRCPAPSALRSIMPDAAAPRYLAIFILGDQRTHLGTMPFQLSVLAITGDSLWGQKNDDSSTGLI
jgi:hypothetical protein